MMSLKNSTSLRGGAEAIQSHLLRILPLWIAAPAMQARNDVQNSSPHPEERHSRVSKGEGGRMK